MPGPTKKRKLKKTVHDKDYMSFLKEDVHGKGLKGMGKYLKRKLTPTPKNVKNRKKLSKKKT
tara:strand:+ start:238 stop:423 length:186 start_codon:yes stop_codon:yes gene_type:complete